ncbi:serine/threonine-protein kinase haspin [Thalassophryne amazonica]|uniref:serine/threonine-protein kinase haspin n=1 Tax=Thalassophryne amazonica TaxID=390379 RepID=UPI0014724AC5|nr:serine/threonine-protein kinase haspin [Thalassophryne amazonica]
MKSVKPLYLKTYGKHRRKLSAWISPENRKQIFETDPSSESDILISEPRKSERTRQKKLLTSSSKSERLAKKKAMGCLMLSSDEENAFSPPPSHSQFTQPSRVTRGKATSVSSDISKGPAKRKARGFLSEHNSDEENIGVAFLLHHESGQQSKTTRKSKYVFRPNVLMRQRFRQVPFTSNSDEDLSEQPSMGRYVTRRRHAVSNKPKLPKKVDNIVNSSDDFTSGGGASDCSRILQSSKWRVPQTILSSSGDNSVAGAGPANFATNPFRDISLSESADCNLRPCCRKPLFCSTPSAATFRKGPAHINQFAISDQSLLSDFQEDLSSLGHHLSQTPSAQPIVLSSKEKLQQSSLYELEKQPNLHQPEEPFDHLLMKLKNTGCSDEPKSHSDNNNTQSCVVLPSPKPISVLSADSESSSYFASAVGGLDWLVEALKQKCLTKSCKVKLRRLDNLTTTQHCYPTTYSSCLGHTSAVCNQNTNKNPSSVDEGQTPDLSQSLVPAVNSHYSVNKNGTSDHLLPAQDSQSSDVSLSDNLPERKKASLNPREKSKKLTFSERPTTSRKACVSGLSVSRWKIKGRANKNLIQSRTVQTGEASVEDCSISHLVPMKHKRPRELAGGMQTFSTPQRDSPLNFSSLLNNLTPSTQTWSRLKAALSLHQKILLSPSSFRPSVPSTPGRADLSQDLFATPLRTPLPKCLRSQLQSSSFGVVCEDDELSDAEKVYAECGQQGPFPWEECIHPQWIKRCVKIGEGTFGEVFSTTNDSGDTVALKVIPVEGNEKVNGEDQKNFGEILHEIIISKELSKLKENQQNQSHGFIGLSNLHCVQGCYPADILKAWDNFDQKKCSENDRPDFFSQEQIFIILEFEFGGVDLESSNGKLASLGMAKSILHQVTAALAVAEQELQFEHRDLHWGNVLVKTTRQRKSSFLLNGTVHSLDNKGVLVRIIDYSLSRLEIDGLTVSCDISNDEELFMGQGDYQFDLYRLMRQENGNVWSDFHPHSNVLWLHYLASKLLSMKFRGPSGRAAKKMRDELTRFYDNILQYQSATEVLLKCPMFQ